MRCWPEFFTELGGAACGPMGMMGEDGTPCGCEADVLGTLSTLILRWLSGAPAFNSDLVDVDAADDTAVFWHCGQAPVSMADPDGPKRATVHSNRKLPLLYEFAFKPGRITLARLSQSKNVVRLVIGGGEVLKRPISYSGTSGWCGSTGRPARCWSGFSARDWNTIYPWPTAIIGRPCADWRRCWTFRSWI